MSIKAYKGFDKNLQCRGFQYEVGKEYETEKASVCDCGFHACENPIDCLNYYEPYRSVYHEVELDGEIDRTRDGDTKVAATKIKIGAELSIPALCKATFEYVRSKCTNENNAEPGKAATAGNCGAATAGEYGAATAGEYGAATAGEYGAATSRGSVKVGENGIGCVRGNGVKACGGMGAILIIAVENDGNYEIKEHATIVIDGKKYRPDTWYTLKNGEVVEVEE